VSRITVSASAHDLWGSDDVPKVRQAQSDIAFTHTLKISAPPITAQNLQIAGIGYVTSSPAQSIRFDVSSDGTNFRYFAGIAGTTVLAGPTNFTRAAPIWLRAVRSGTTWTFYTSDDGSSFTSRYSGTINGTVTHVFHWAGNAGSNPAYTAEFDFFEDAADPLGGGGGNRRRRSLLAA
jgi:hypothetical protein